MVHGFDTEESPVPDYLVCEVSLREWSRRITDGSTLDYWTWKVFQLENAIQRSVEHGIMAMTFDEMTQLTYRIKALQLTRRTLVKAQAALKI